MVMSFRIETKAMKAKIGFFYKIDWLTWLRLWCWTNNHYFVSKRPRTKTFDTSSDNLRKCSVAKVHSIVIIVSAWLRTKNLMKVSGTGYLRRILFVFNSSKKLISISALSSKSSHIKKWNHFIILNFP